MGIPIDLSELSEAAAAEFMECRHNADLMALLTAEQEQTAIAQQSQGDHRSIDGIGAPILNIAPASYHFWGLREGYECWQDNGFVREFRRDNPAARVKAGGTRTQVGYSGLEGSKLQGAGGARGGKFRKSYGTAAGEAAIRR